MARPSQGAARLDWGSRRADGEQGKLDEGSRGRERPEGLGPIADDLLTNPQCRPGDSSDRISHQARQGSREEAKEARREDPLPPGAIGKRPILPQPGTDQPEIDVWTLDWWAQKAHRWNRRNSFHLQGSVIIIKDARVIVELNQSEWGSKAVKHYWASLVGALCVKRGV